MQKDETKGTSLQPEVLDPEQQSQSEILGKWTATTYSTSEEMLEVISRLVSGRFKWKIHASHYFLTTEELKMIKYLGVADSRAAAADVALHRNFPGTLFDKTLVKRIMKIAKEGVDASEDNNIKKLVTCGKRCLERGEKFDLTWDYPKEDKAILNGVSFQEDLKNKLKKVSGDSIQVDTTHGMSRYRLVAMFPYGIDCFRTTINFGCSMMESEPSKDVVKGLKLLGLQDVVVIMTDGSKTLEEAVEEVGASHVLCRKHILANLNSSTSGLKGMKKIKFTSSLDDVLTGIFSEEKDLISLLKICWLNILKNHSKEDKDFSKEADEMFTKELKLMGACWIVEELSSTKFIVSDSNLRVKMKYVLEVVEREGVKLQSCTCETWTNQRFPCRHYARYCDRKRIQYMSIDHLPERWRYQEHPLFKQALREMGREVDGPRGFIELKVRVPPVNAAHIPRKPEAKYSKLLTACKALCEEVKSSNEGWKRSYPQFPR
eukprot:augustus_masked-scaffold_18-processed-gene-2.13-mRNA-1 protein AED:1.00 eAED:1.00 QI:0/0/0/0/1/1/3/0/488